VKSAFTAFAAGAKAFNPAVRVFVSYLGTWDDAGAGKEQALAQIGRGADVIYQDADAAGLGVFQAARESKDVYVIGSNANQNAVAREITLGSAVIDLPHAFLLVAREVRAGTFKPRVVRLDTKTDVVRWTVNPALASRIPERAAHMVDSVLAQMRAGTFVSPVPASTP
jgi:basic membrane protein A